MFYRTISMKSLRRRVDDVALELMATGQPVHDHHCRPGWVYEIENGVGALYHITEVDGVPTLNWGDEAFSGGLDDMEAILANKVRQDLQDAADDFGEEFQDPLLQPAFYVVCVAMTDKAYGGPEEGGWYYDTTEPCLGGDYPIPVVVKTRDEAEAAADKMDADFITDANEGRPSTSSVLSRGRYTAMIYEGEWPTSLPKEIPHYE